MPARDHPLGDRMNRKHAAAEPQRPGDESPSPVDNLRDELRSARRRIERSRSEEQRRGRRAQLRHLHRPLPKRAVKRSMQLPAHE